MSKMQENPAPAAGEPAQPAPPPVAPFRLEVDAKGGCRVLLYGRDMTPVVASVALDWDYSKRPRQMVVKLGVNILPTVKGTNEEE